MKYYVTIDGRTYEVDVEPEGVRVDGDPLSVDVASAAGDGVTSALVGGRSLRIVAAAEGQGLWALDVNGHPFRAEVVDDRTRRVREMTSAGAGPSGPEPIRAPMPGLVVKIEVSVGETVEAGQGIVIVEAMKMENELKANSAGVVSNVLVEPGQAVEKDQVLVELEGDVGEAET